MRSSTFNKQIIEVCLGCRPRMLNFDHSRTRTSILRNDFRSELSGASHHDHFMTESMTRKHAVLKAERTSSIR